MISGEVSISGNGSNRSENKFLVAFISISDVHRLQCEDYLDFRMYGILPVVQCNDIYKQARSPPHIPEVSIPVDQAVNIALSLRHDINKSFAVLRDIVNGRNLKKFLTDKVDFYWDKAIIELKKHYNVIYAKVANKIPSAAQLKAKKH